MDKQIQRMACITSLILLVLTIVWIVFTGISMSQVKASWSDYDYLKWVSNPDIFYTVNYINATILTFVVVILFTVLFKYLYEKSKLLALMGLIFIPIYGVLNLVCYSIQITIIPTIAKNVIRSSGDLQFALQLVQSRSETIIGFINGLAYAILGIPSIIYGYLLSKDKKKLSGLFLLLNGVLCVVGIIGYMMKDPILSTGIMLGGIVFLMSLAFMVIEFRYKK